MIRFVCLTVLVCLLPACREQASTARETASLPPIVPDYTEVTVPASIAPLNFTLEGEFERINAVLEGSRAGQIEVQGKEDIRIPVKEWHTLLEANKGESIHITVAAKRGGQWELYRPFSVYVSPYAVDYGLVYRLVAPGYEVYGKMGIYRRTLSDFTQKPLIENTLVPGSCVNCHSFKETNPAYMSLHVRGEYGGTLLQSGNGETDLLNLKTEATISGGVYPYWHPSGDYIAYSVNKTQQMFHSAADERIEVVDLASDVIVYNIKENRILSTPLLKTEDFETFPAFSPDGHSLYFTCAAKRTLPGEYKDIRYNLCRIDFDPETGMFGNRIDTLVNAASAGKSISFPRPSYDGKYLMYTLSDYGNFSIWHKEADLWLLDLQSEENRPLDEVNSPDTDSYHSWSSNSRWFVFSSRRGDGLYTRLYLASIDEDGSVSKPFLLPQEKARLDDPLFFSYNVPEFVSGEVDVNIREAERQLRSSVRKQAR
ncbi:translocation protein TolB [Bacteroidales bacterium Barb7]|nr:translocation protein TolB [Bacteroidales bacterium Barb7]